MSQRGTTSFNVEQSISSSYVIINEQQLILAKIRLMQETGSVFSRGTRLGEASLLPAIHVAPACLGHGMDAVMAKQTVLNELNLW